MTLVIHLVRHGEVYNPQQVFYARLPRFGLSQRGREQAQAAGAYLAQHPIAALFSSPLLRARQTAQIIAQTCQLAPVKQSKHLLEVHTPYQGQSYSVLEAIQWDIYRDIAPDYEQPADLVARLQCFVAQVKRDYAGQTVVAVTHGDIVVFAQLWARGLPLTQANRMSIRPYPQHASLTTLSFEDGRDLPAFRFHVPY
jgi:broad specificity phosphatase PhoE